MHAAQVSCRPSCCPTAALPATGQETVRLADEIVVLRGINPVRLTGDQIRALLDILRPGVQRLEQQEQANAKQLAALIPQMRQAAVQLTAAPVQMTPPDSCVG